MTRGRSAAERLERDNLDGNTAKIRVTILVSRRESRRPEDNAKIFASPMRLIVASVGGGPAPRASVDSFLPARAVDIHFDDRGVTDETVDCGEGYGLILLYRGQSQPGRKLGPR